MAYTQQQLDALQWLESLLCNDFLPETEERTFETREGYRTVFTGIFTAVTSVKINGKDASYYPAFFDKRNGDFYNSIVLDKAVRGEVVINASWGFTDEDLPADLKRLIDNAYAAISSKKPVKDVKRKKVRNFDITFGDLSDDEVFLKNNAVTIDKYSLCNIGYVRHGRTCKTHRARRCGICF